MTQRQVGPGSFSYLLVLLSLLLSCGSTATGTVPEDIDSLHRICMENALCRNLFQQEHGEMSRVRFQALLSHLPDIVASEQTGSTESLLADRLSLYHLIYSDSRCPPNQYWQWNATTEQGVCTCYLDRDCRVDVLSLCHPQAHPVLFASFVIVICFQFALVVQQNFCPPRESKRSSSRV